MAVAVDTDIDAFIREQKQKLASERQALHSPEKRTRRKWDAPEHPFNESVLLRDVHAGQQTLQQPRRPDHSILPEFKQEGSRAQRETSEEKPSLPFGEYEDKRKALVAQRQQDYNEMIKKQGGGQNSNLVRQTDEYKANFPGMNESDNAKLQNSKTRWTVWDLPCLKYNRDSVDIKPYSVRVHVPINHGENYSLCIYE